MPDRPILFSAPMVLGILREIEKPGTGKTQTRRIASLRKGLRLDDIREWKPVFSRDQIADPRYAVGDRLYVREAWRVSKRWDDTPPRDLEPRKMSIVMEAGGSIANEGDPLRWIPSDWPHGERPDWIGKFRQGMHMPRWASRITLIVTDVRVQRLQKISQEDAIAEGPGFVGKITGEVCESVAAHRTGLGPRWRTPRDWYADLWDSLNAKRGYGWDTNPWVAAYTFTPELRNIDARPC